MDSGGAMTAVSRLALATSASGPEPSVMALALLAGLTAKRWRVQHFRSRACPTAIEVVGQLTGLPGRHLDAWLMPPEVCRSLFLRGMQAAELAVVEGTLDPPLPVELRSRCALPGDLRPIVTALDLPVLAVVTLPETPEGSVHLPRLPEGVDGVLIDGLRDLESLPRVRRLIRMAWNLPVVGALEPLPAVRAALEANGPKHLPPDLFLALGERFLKHADLETIRSLAQSRPFPGDTESVCACGKSPCTRCIRVAYACDEAFGRYFPDTLEALEALGAELVEFSPLRDESLPIGVDLVLIGCGMPDQYAEELASNLSMIAALRQHVCRGQRIYSEGGGTAYLGRWMVVGGQKYPGARIFPLEAELVDPPGPPVPVTRQLLMDCWLGPKGATVRGYRSGRWRFRSSMEGLECPACCGTLAADGDLVYHHHAVGSLIHLHLGALPDVVAAFAGPHHPSLRRPSIHGLPPRPSGRL